MKPDNHYLKNELYGLIREDAIIFDFIQEGALDGIWYWDLQEPEHEWMSPRFWTTLGYDPVEKKHLVSEWQDLIFKQDMDTAVENYIKHCENPDHPYDQVVRYRHKDGSIVWIRCRGIAIRNRQGKPVRMLGAHTDLTKQKLAEEKLQKANDSLEMNVMKRTVDLAQMNDQLKHELDARKKAEQALKESEARYRSMMNAMKDAAYIGSPDFHVMYMNQAMKELVGQGALGKNCYKVIHGLDEKCPWCVQDKIQNKQSADIEIISPRDGRSYLVSNSPLMHEDGTISKMAVYKDTTDMKRLETQLRQSQKMEAIGTLAGGVAHDFNNILTAIIGNAELLLLEDRLDDRIKEGLEEILKSGHRASDLTRQLLAFSRKQVIRPIVLDLNNVLADLEKMLVRLIGEDIDIRILPGQDLWQLRVDRIQLEQVLINLAVNGRDAMPSGGKLTIETANMEIDEGYLSRHGIDGPTEAYVMLAVSDTGTGIDPATRERIFEPFFTTKESGRGTGLGLSSVYGIVKQNKGFVWVYSEKGHGSTFKVYLPRSSNEITETDPGDISVKMLEGYETVLIVEDDEYLRKVVKIALDQFGYKTLEACDGQAAVSLCESYGGQIDLMITDVVMPRMSGRETADRVKVLFPDIRVVFVSGYTDNAIVHHGVLDSGIHFLEKPFSPEKLLRKVRFVLDGEQ